MLSLFYFLDFSFKSYDVCELNITMITVHFNYAELDGGSTF